VYASVVAEAEVKMGELLHFPDEAEEKVCGR